jgi:Kef-type K+ transport system membrane component KefB
VPAGSVLLDICVVLVAAKVAAEAAERLRLPAVVGEIVAGVVIGPSVLGLVEGDEVLRVLGELGVILLLLEVGLQLELAELRAVGRASLLVAVCGVALPFALGAGATAALGHGGHTAVFMGAALTATSVGITARVFGDLRALAGAEARTVLGAAVADDVLGLVILTVVARLVTGAALSPASVVGLAGLAVGFLVVGGAAGLRLAPPLFGLLHRRARSHGTLFALALAFTLGFAELADAARLAPIVGAFVAGLALARSAQADRIRRDLVPLGQVFVPVFFLQIGIDADVSAFARPAVLGLAGALLAAAVAGKLAAGVGAAGSPGDKLAIGLGMLPRGEVGLIFATIGLRAGVLGDDLYAALLLVVLATTLLTPPLLSARLRRVAGHPAVAAGVSAPPPGGWLRADGNTVELAAEPAGQAGLAVALDAARLLASGRPGPRLAAWAATLAGIPLRWDGAATAALFRLLAEGNARSWRFLEQAGVLDRALPELAESLRRRRAGGLELDPDEALRWALLERVRELPLDGLAHPEWLLLAALVVDVAGGNGTAVPAARSLVQRLDLGAAAEQEVALLVADPGLFPAVAARPDGLSEESVLRVAAHVDVPERARALHLLGQALGDAEPWRRERAEELHELVQQALSDPALSGREARNLAARRAVEAARLAGEGTPAAERAAHGPRSWLLAHPPADLARQAALLEPLPRPGRVRVAVTPGPRPGLARVDVASRDRPGLLAAVTGALREAGDVVEATVATWPDGGAIESFTVAAPELDAAALTRAIEGAFSRPLSSPPLPDAVVRFSDASPWYTICEVEAGDRRGLLHALAVAMAAAGADVHSARVTTVAGRAVDRFELTDRDGRKLDERARARVAAAVAGGAATGGRRWRSRLGRGSDARKQGSTKPQSGGDGGATSHP